MGDGTNGGTGGGDDDNAGKSDGDGDGDGDGTPGILSGGPPADKSAPPADDDGEAPGRDASIWVAPTATATTTAATKRTNRSRIAHLRRGAGALAPLPSFSAGVVRGTGADARTVAGTARTVAGTATAPPPSVSGGGRKVCIVVDGECVLPDRARSESSRVVRKPQAMLIVGFELRNVISAKATHHALTMLSDTGEAIEGRQPVNPRSLSPSLPSRGSFNPFRGPKAVRARAGCERGLADPPDVRLRGTAAWEIEGNERRQQKNTSARRSGASQRTHGLTATNTAERNECRTHRLWEFA